MALAPEPVGASPRRGQRQGWRKETHGGAVPVQDSWEAEVAVPGRALGSVPVRTCLSVPKTLWGLSPTPRQEGPIRKLLPPGPDTPPVMRGCPPEATSSSLFSGRLGPQHPSHPSSGHLLPPPQALECSSNLTPGLLQPRAGLQAGSAVSLGYLRFCKASAFQPISHPTD